MVHKELAILAILYVKVPPDIHIHIIYYVIIIITTTIIIIISTIIIIIIEILSNTVI